jgi:hypothetical protein
MKVTFLRFPPPSVESMIDQFADWMAQHAQAKVTVRLDFRDGTHWTAETDHRGPRPKVGAGETPHNVEGKRPSAACGDRSA